MDRFKFAAVVAALAACSGCASIIDGRSQPITVQTAGADGWSVAGATCTLTNAKGSWTLTTPGKVKVLRSAGALDIACDKPGVPGGTLKVNASTKGLALTNFLLFPPGFGVDAATSNAWDYPTSVTVRMGTDGTATMRQPPLPERYWIHSDE